MHVRDNLPITCKVNIWFQSFISDNRVGLLTIRNGFGLINYHIGFFFSEEYYHIGIEEEDFIPLSVLTWTVTKLKAYQFCEEKNVLNYIHIIIPLINYLSLIL